MLSKLIAVTLVGTALAGKGGGGKKGDDGVGECQTEWVENTTCAYSGPYSDTGECVAGVVLTAPMPAPPGAPGRALRGAPKGPPPLTADECLALCEAENDDGCCEYLAPKGPKAKRHARDPKKKGKKGPPQCVFYPGGEVDFMGAEGAATGGKGKGSIPPYQSVVCGKNKAPKNGYVGPKKAKKNKAATIDPCPKKYGGPFDPNPACDECAGRLGSGAGPDAVLSASAASMTSSSTVVIVAMAGTVSPLLS